MKCPYCSNEISNNSTKCEICGVSLKESLNHRNDIRMISIASLVIGCIFLFVSILWIIALKAPSFIFKDFNASNVNVSVPANVAFFLIGFILLGLGIFGLKNSNKLRDTNGKGYMLATMISIPFVAVFIIILLVSFNINYRAYNSPDMFRNYGFAIFIPMLTIPIIAFIIIIISIIKGMRK